MAVAVSSAVRPPAPELDERLEPLTRCWVCAGEQLVPVHRAFFDHQGFAEQDPGLHGYTGCTVWIQRCRGCGFAQPQGLPKLPHYFERMYDLRWAEYWLEQEFVSTTKDRIFHGILQALGRRVPAPRRTLLDVGAHVGRFLHLAERAGWRAGGIEPN